MSDGVYQIDVVATADGVETGVNKAKSKLAELGASAEGAGKKIDGIGDGADSSAKKIDQSTRSMISSIQRTTAIMEAGEKGSTKYYEALASQRGVSVDALKPYLAQLDAANAKHAAATGSMNTLGLSAKQLSASMRGVPAQFTDIITSLQGGQAPLTVFMQQGGQLKDMFGGAGNAAKAMGGYIIGLINPITLAAGGIGALALAYYQGAAEGEAFQKSLILTGNIAGTTAGQLSDMAKSVSGKSGASIGAVAETLNEIAAGGKVTAEALELVSKAAVDMERAGGQAASATVKEFTSLGDAPVSAIIKLNDKYHFLTASVYEQIKALQDQGRETEAATLAQETYASAIEGRVPSLVQNLGLLEKGWKGIISAAKGAWDVMSGVGRAESLNDQLSVVNKKIEMASADPVWGDIYNNSGQADTPNLEKQKRVIEAMIAGEKAITDIVAQQNKAREAGLAWSQESTKYADQQAKKQAEILRVTTMMTAAGKDQAEIAKVVAQIESKGKGSGGAASSGEAKSLLSFDIEKIKKGGEAAVSAYSNSEKTVESMHSAALLSDKDYYASKAAFINLEAEAQESALQKTIARLQQEKLSGKEAIDNKKKILDAESALEKVRDDAAAKLEVNKNKEASALEKVRKAYASAQSAADAYLATVEKQNQRAVDGIGKGDKYRTDQSAINQIEDKFTAQKQSIAIDRIAHPEMSDQYDQYLKIAQETYEKEVALYGKRTTDIDAKQADWLNGATEAMANYSTSAKNISQQVSTGFTDAFSSIEDAMVTWAQTGELSFAKLGNSIIATLVRIQTQAALSSITSGIQGWLSGLAVPSNANTTIPMQVGGGYHTGGIVGSEPTFTRSVPASLFAGATKYHTGGIVGDEVPIVAKKGEGVFTAGQMAAMGSGSANVSVTVNNTASDKVESTVKPKMNNGKLELEVLITQVLTKDMRNNGSITQGLSSTFGLARAT